MKRPSKSSPRKYEGSPLDEKRDRREAKKRGMSVAAWERSAADKKMDRAGQRELDKKRNKSRRR